MDSSLSVLLLSLPFSTLNHPSIGLTRVQSALKEAGITAEMRHIFLAYAEYIGVDDYTFISDDKYFQALLGEFIFSSIYYETSVDAVFRYFNEVLLASYPQYFGATSVIRVINLIEKSRSFVEICLKTINWGSFDIVGFTSSFQQTMASVVLARRLKDIHPNLLIVMGGANCEGDMGVALLKAFDFIDAVCSGEGEIAFTEFCKDVAKGFPKCTEGNIAGIIFRDGPKIVLPKELTSPVYDLDTLPPLNFDSFFAEHQANPNVASAYPAVPLFETSRGCWWGAKHHCTFCGLNGSTMTYRSKQPMKAYAELQDLTTRYGSEVLVVDNILSMNYFASFLQCLADSDRVPLIHYEVKVNLKPSQVALLAKAGVRKIQPGVESLSDNVLRLMRKGCTATQNIQLLRLAAEAGIFVEWGLLYGFPGETAADYRDIACLIPKLSHLQSPSGLTKVRADRFSPYHSNPSQFGTKISPSSSYGHIYRIPSDLIADIAYHFDIISDRDEELDASVVKVIAAAQTWHSMADKHYLTVRYKAQRLALISEGRMGREPKRYELEGLSAQILEYTWCCRSLVDLRSWVSQTSNIERLNRCLEELEQLDLIVRDERQVIALPLRLPGLVRAPSRGEIRRVANERLAFGDQVGLCTQWAKYSS